MGKHKRSRDSEPQNQYNSPNPFNQNMLMEMLNNVDISQLGSLINALNTNGVNLNDININSSEDKQESNDKTVQLLNSLKPFLTPKRAQIIDKIVEMYLAGEFDE